MTNATGRLTGRALRDEPKMLNFLFKIPQHSKCHTTYELNKIFLLRERKRHTVRRVSSTAVLSQRGVGGNPSQDGRRGHHIPGPGVYPIPGQGGTPVLVRETDKQTETITFPHPLDAGDNNVTF